MSSEADITCNDFSHLFKIPKKMDEISAVLDCVKNNTVYVPKMVKEELIPRFGTRFSSATTENYDPWAIMLAIKLVKINKKVGYTIMEKHWPNMINTDCYTDDRYYFRYYTYLQLMIDNANGHHGNNGRKYTALHTAGWFTEKIYAIFGIFSPFNAISFRDALLNNEILAEDVVKMYLNHHITQKIAQRIDPNFLDIEYDNYDDDDLQRVTHVYIVLIYSIIAVDYLRFQKAIEFMLANIRSIKDKKRSFVLFYLLDFFDDLAYHCPEYTCRIIAFITDHYAYNNRNDFTLFRAILARGAEMFLVPISHVYNLRPLYRYLDRSVTKIIKVVSRGYGIVNNKNYMDIVVLCE